LKKLFICFALLTGILLLGCKEEIEEVNIDYGYDYFPTTIGSSLIYQVDSTIYDDFQDTVFTISYEVKEEIIATTAGLEGNPTYTIAHYERADAGISWDNVTPRIWYMSVSDNTAERTEENLRFIKMVFPVREGQQWAGNEHIDTNDERLTVFADWEYEYLSVDEPYALETLNFDTTVTVFQQDFSTLKDKVFGQEVYAKGIGLVYREFMDLELLASSLPPLDQIDWPERANKGVHVVWRLKEF